MLNPRGSGSRSQQRDKPNHGFSWGLGVNLDPSIAGVSDESPDAEGVGMAEYVVTETYSLDPAADPDEPPGQVIAHAKQPL